MTALNAVRFAHFWYGTCPETPHSCWRWPVPKRPHVAKAHSPGALAITALNIVDVSAYAFTVNKKPGRYPRERPGFAIARRDYALLGPGGRSLAVTPGPGGSSPALTPLLTLRSLTHKGGNERANSSSPGNIFVCAKIQTFGPFAASKLRTPSLAAFRSR